MVVPAAHGHRYAYHSTHLNNLQSVLEHGFLSVNEQLRRGLQHHSIAASGIQERRAKMVVPCGPAGFVHDYVPLYLTKLSPMLLAQVQARNVDQVLLLHFAFPIAVVDRPNAVFTDAAANRITPPTFYSDPARLDDLVWQAIDSTKWGSKIGDIDYKHERMAEVLVHTRLDPGDASYIVVWNEWVKEKVAAAYSKVGVPPPEIRFHGPDNNHGFSHFRPGLPPDMLHHSIAPGPFWTRHIYDHSVAAITKHPGARVPRFSSLHDMLAALRTHGLAALPETEELRNLESANDVHKHDIGTHTLRVVQGLVASPEYAELPPGARPTVELAAFLHDIGKGPKSRWVGSGGKQEVDASHPLRSTEMLVRILTEEIPKLDDETVGQLCTLVCYHDLVGDIIGRGRDRQQLPDVAGTPLGVAMLVALGKADLASVADSWGVAGASEIRSLRDWAVGQLPE